MAPTRKFIPKDRAAEVTRDFKGGSMLWGIEDALCDAIKATRADILERARAKAKTYGAAAGAGLKALIEDLEKLPPP